MKRAFFNAGHLPTLVSCFLYFDLSFMVWVLLGPMAVLIAKDLGLSPGEQGLMVATPVLAGALLRIVNGVLVGQWLPRLDQRKRPAVAAPFETKVVQWLESRRNRSKSFPGSGRCRRGRTRIESAVVDLE